MAKHTDNNHNIWYDGMTLTNCTYVHCGEGTTGTISNCNYAEIGENNSLTINNVNYITVGDNNTDITVSNADYIIIGLDNDTVRVGSQTNTDRFTRVGGNSITVLKRNVGVELTGGKIDINKTKYGAIDGFFNKLDNCGSVVLENANGNKLEHSRTIELIETNNDYVFADNLELENKDAFTTYKTLDNIILVGQTKKSMERQSDSLGTVLDTQTDKLDSDETKISADSKYTMVNGLWTETVE